MAKPTAPSDDLRLSVEEIRAVDAYAIEELGVPGVVLMENAGRNAAELIEHWSRRRRKDPHRAMRASVLCGRGNNGGDGFVIARHLARLGWHVDVDLHGDVDKLSPDAAVNHGIAERMGIPVRSLAGDAPLGEAIKRWRESDVCVDALLGTGFSGQVRAPLDAIISRLNELDGPLIVAIDVPSGFDADRGIAEGLAVRAHRTITFVAQKKGYTRAPARAYLGRISVADIGIPRDLVLKRLRKKA